MTFERLSDNEAHLLPGVSSVELRLYLRRAGFSGSKTRPVGRVDPCWSAHNELVGAGSCGANGRRGGDKPGDRLGVALQERYDNFIGGEWIAPTTGSTGRI